MESSASTSSDRSGHSPRLALLSELESLMGSTTGEASSVDEDKAVAKRKEDRRRASEARAVKRKEIGSRKPKPKYLDYLKHRLGQEVDPADGKQNWTGYLTHEKNLWWKAVSQDTPHIRFIKFHGDMVVGCPSRDNRRRLCL